MGKQRDRSTRARDSGEDTEPCLGQWEVGNWKGVYHLHPSYTDFCSKEKHNNFLRLNGVTVQNITVCKSRIINYSCLQFQIKLMKLQGACCYRWQSDSQESCGLAGMKVIGAQISFFQYIKCLVHVQDFIIMEGSLVSVKYTKNRENNSHYSVIKG